MSDIPHRHTILAPQRPTVTVHPLWVAGAPRGRIIESVGQGLTRLPEIFNCSPEGYWLRDEGLDAKARSALLQRAAIALREAGLVPGWRDELCVLFDDGDTELARFERGAFRTLGLQNRAVHVNGFLVDGRQWIARRSATRLSAPNKLDNLAAGAITAGESPEDCARRELREEAGVSGELASRVIFCGRRLRSLRPLPHGVHDEMIICADLLLPNNFQPVCQDGEVAEFHCMKPHHMRAALTAGEFSIEAAMVVRDWLERNY